MQFSLVFTESMSLNDVPYTTGDIIAEHAEMTHKAVNHTINENITRLKRAGNGHVLFKKERSLAGRTKKVYWLNEQQATLLITFLKNTEQVADFKEELVRQFFAMKHELMQRQLTRESGKQVRRSMTDAIRDSEVLNSAYDYGNFTRLVYKTALGISAAQLRKARGIKPGSPALDWLSSDELKAVNKREIQVTTLIDLGLTYKEIKSILDNKGVIYQATLKLPEKEVS